MVNTPKETRVAAMPAFAPRLVADVSKMKIMGLVASVTAQLNRLSLCMAHRKIILLQFDVATNLYYKQGRYT